MMSLARPRFRKLRFQMIADTVLGDRPSVPSMGRILLDERSQSEPMTATVANRKA